MQKIQNPPEVKKTIPEGSIKPTREQCKQWFGVMKHKELLAEMDPEDVEKMKEARHSFVITGFISKESYDFLKRIQEKSRIR